VRAGSWSRGTAAIVPVGDSRLWRIFSETGDRDPSSRARRGSSVTTVCPVVSDGCVTCDGEWVSEGSAPSRWTRPH